MKDRYIMRLPEVIQRTGYKRSSLLKFASEGKFPKPVPLGGRAVGWDSLAVQEWINDKLNKGEAA